MKKRMFQFILLALVLSIIANPSLAVDSAKDGAYLWFNTLLPSLLPFLILSELFISSGFVEVFGKLLGNIMKPIFNVPGSGAFPLLVSSISGYPIGAKLTSDLRKNKYINKTEANRLISFTSTSGPLFILGSILIGMLNMPELGTLMILPHYLGTITVGIIFRFYKRSANPQSSVSITHPQAKEANIKNTNLEIDSIGKLISRSVKQSMDSIILIGGFIILYSVIIEILLASKFMIKITSILSYYTKIDITIIEAILSGFIELTTGCKKISSVNMNPLYKIMILNSLIAWSGLSILSQAISFISQTDINIKLYVFSKFLHSIFASIYTYIIYLLRFKDIAIPSSNITTINENFNFNNWIYNISLSTKLSLSICILFIIFSLLIKKLFLDSK
ncbi:MAG TPA: sporulation integral membrane protein YlbJ [Tissierellaceae bacterium]|nr:sporulation integral membrane protein YlbJ [Tissierellaceae bacterium]